MSFYRTARTLSRDIAQTSSKIDMLSGQLRIIVNNLEALIDLYAAMVRKPDGSIGLRSTYRPRPSRRTPSPETETDK